MSEELPVIKPREAVAALLKAGFVLKRQKGSHAHYGKGNLTVTVPMHRGDLKAGTLRSILRQARMTPGEFKALL